MVWKSSQDELNQFIKEINEVHPSIKFTTESSKTQVNFLDTTIQINDSKLTTKPSKNKLTVPHTFTTLRITPTNLKTTYHLAKHYD